MSTWAKFVSAHRIQEHVSGAFAQKLEFKFISSADEPAALSPIVGSHSLHLHIICIKLLNCYCRTQWMTRENLLYRCIIHKLYYVEEDALSSYAISINRQQEITHRERAKERIHQVRRINNLEINSFTAASLLIHVCVCVVYQVVSIGCFQSLLLHIFIRAFYAFYVNFRTKAQEFLHTKEQHENANRIAHTAWEKWNESSSENI